jgi:DNA polymerase/3'-5' exonuclease PolX
MIKKSILQSKIFVQETSFNIVISLRNLDIFHVTGFAKNNKKSILQSKVFVIETSLNILISFLISLKFEEIEYILYQKSIKAT